MRFYRGQTLSSYPKRIGGGSDDDGAADQPAVRADPHSVSPVMVEQAVQAAAVCVTASLLALVVKRGSPESALLLALGAAVAVLLALAGTAGDIAAFFRELGSRSGIPRELLVPLYKTVGIALVVKIGGGLCADAGEKALTAVVETAGAVFALAVSLPLIRAVVVLMGELMG